MVLRIFLPCSSIAAIVSFQVVSQLCVSLEDVGKVRQIAPHPHVNFFPVPGSVSLPSKDGFLKILYSSSSNNTCHFPARETFFLGNGARVPKQGLGTKLPP